MRLLIVITIIFSMNAHAAKNRKSVECGVQILTAGQSNVQTKDVTLKTKLDVNGNGVAKLEDENFSASMDVREDFALKNFYYVQLELVDKAATENNRVMLLAALKPRKDYPEQKETFSLMTAFYSPDNGVGQVLFTWATAFKLKKVNPSIDNAVVTILSSGAYFEAAEEAIKQGLIKKGDFLGLAVYDICK